MDGGGPDSVLQGQYSLVRFAPVSSQFLVHGSLYEEYRQMVNTRRAGVVSFLFCVFRAQWMTPCIIGEQRMLAELMCEQ